MKTLLLADVLFSVLNFVGYDYKKERAQNWAGNGITDIQLADLGETA